MALPFDFQDVPSMEALQEVYLETKTNLTRTEKNIHSYSLFFNKTGKRDDLAIDVQLPSTKSENSKTDRNFDPKCNRDFRGSLGSLNNSDSEPSEKMAVKSLLVPNLNENKKRKIVARIQNAKVESRNRRMLGIVQGTLLKFKDEAEKEKPEILKRLEKEQEIERAARHEWKDMLKQSLKDKEKKQKMLRCLRNMMILVEKHERWKRSQQSKLCFLITKSKPRIYFLPKLPNLKTFKMLKQSKREVLEHIKKRQQILLEELTEIKRIYLSEIELERMRPINDAEICSTSIIRG